MNFVYRPHYQPALKQDTCLNTSLFTYLELSNYQKAKFPIMKYESIFINSSLVFKLCRNTEEIYMGKGGSSKDTYATRQSRGERLIQERVHDPYKIRSKLPEPTVCPECQAVFHQGRWAWTEIPTTANQELCPACRRIRDRVPAGFLTLSGKFYQEHREEIINTIRNKEGEEKARHPLKRIMDIEDRNGETVITFTEIHLPRGIGEALNNAYKGELDYQYTDEVNILRVRWHR
jgi:hypothetical protein